MHSSYVQYHLGLDYGYQVMLSVFAREIALEGYLVQLGIFHDNIYNNFNLASDLIEPFRPLVDYVVRVWFSNRDQVFDKAEVIIIDLEVIPVQP